MIQIDGFVIKTIDELQNGDWLVLSNPYDPYERFATVTYIKTIEGKTECCKGYTRLGFLTHGDNSVVLELHNDKQLLVAKVKEIN